MSADLHPGSSSQSADLHFTADELCKMHGISRRMYFNALNVRRNGCDELQRLVLDGDVSMNLALEVVKFDHASQRLILAEFPTINPRDRAAFVQRVRAANERERANGGLLQEQPAIEVLPA